MTHTEWVNRLFNQMAAIYMSRWKAKESDKRGWVECLDGFVVEKLEFGLKKLMHSEKHGFSTRPPTMLEFKKLCEGYGFEEKLPQAKPAWASQNPSLLNSMQLKGSDAIESKRVAYINLLKVYKHLGNRKQWDRLKSDYNIFCAKYGAGDKTEIQKRTLIAEIAAHKQLIEEFDTVKNYNVSNAYREQLEKKKEDLFKITSLAA